MKKALIALLVCVGLASISWAQTTIINTGFTAVDGYADGTIAGQNSWINMPNTDPNAFYIADSAGVGFANGTLAVADFSTNNIGQYVYLNTASAGNSIDDEWSGVMDFQISVNPLDPGAKLTRTKIFNIGLTAVATNHLRNVDTNDVFATVKVDNDGSLQIQFNGNETMAVLPLSNTGWDPENNLTNGADFVTDHLQLSWTMRKTSDDGVYGAWATLSNLDTTSNSTGSAVYHVRDLVYANAAPAFAMGRSQNADFNGGTNIHSVVIDNLSVVKNSGVAPAPVAPVIIAASGDTQVSLTWDYLYDVDSYIIKRSLTPTFGYSAIDTISNTNTTYVDTGLANNTPYYYKVTANYGAVPATSAEVFSTPVSIVTGSIFDTDFTATDGYVDGDLAGQQSWIRLFNSGTNAFDVDSTGTGVADTLPTAATWSTNGNAVYWGKAMSNSVNATWSGTLDFQISTVAYPDTYKTNTWRVFDIVGGVTNSITTNTVIHAVATSQNQNFVVYELGLTASDSDPLAWNAANQVGIQIQSRAGFELRAVFNSAGNNRGLFTQMPAELLGWDPQWSSQTNLLSDGPDFETDMIRMSYTIQKSAASGWYLATASFSNLVTGVVSTNEGGNNKVADFWEYEKPAVYDAPLAKFAMGKSPLADGLGASSEMDIRIDAIGLDHDLNADPMLFPPTWSASAPVAAISGSVTLQWNDATQATDVYKVLRSVYDGHSYVEIGVVSNATVFVDTDVIDVWTYYYVLRSASGTNESANSSQESGAPVPTTYLLQMGANNSWTTANSPKNPSFENLGGTTTSNIVTVAPIDPLLTENVSASGIYAENTVRGIMQFYTGQFRRARVMNRNDPVTLKVESGQLGSANTNSAILLYVQASEMDSPAATVSLVDQAYKYELDVASLTRADSASTNDYIHAAVRQGGTWYVSEKANEGSGVLVIDDLGASSNLWAVLDTSVTTSFMSIIGVTNLPVTLNSVDAIGWFSENTKILAVASLTVSVQDVSGITGYDWWQAGNLLVPPAGDMGSDPDGDGAVNLMEFGLNGDPSDVGNTGVAPEIDMVNMGGTNYLQYVHLRRKGTNLGISYKLKDTVNLVFIPMTNDAAVAAQYIGDYDANYESVTNLIPVTENEKFIRLEIEGL